MSPPQADRRRRRRLPRTLGSLALVLVAALIGILAAIRGDNDQLQSRTQPASRTAGRANQRLGQGPDRPSPPTAGQTSAPSTLVIYGVVYERATTLSPSIEGAAARRAGSALSFATVDLVKSEEDGTTRVLQRARTDAQGRYAFRVSNPAIQQHNSLDSPAAVPRMPGEFAQLFVRTLRDDGATARLTVADGQLTTRGVSLDLAFWPRTDERRLLLHGRVSWSDGPPVAHARVSWRLLQNPTAKSPPPFAATSQADADGYYEIRVPSASGRWAMIDLRVRPRTSSRYWTARCPFGIGQTEKSYDVVLPRASGTLAVRVVVTGGALPSDTNEWQVWAVSLDSAAVFQAEAAVKRPGVAVFRDLPVGRYSLGLRDMPANWKYAAGMPAASVRAAETSHVSLKLEAAATLDLTVSSDTGLPVPEALVMVQALGWSDGRIAAPEGVSSAKKRYAIQTDSRGRVSLRLPAAVTTVLVEIDVDRYAAVSRVLRRNSAAWGAATLSLHERGVSRIRGRVQWRQPASSDRVSSSRSDVVRLFSAQSSTGGPTATRAIAGIERGGEFEFAGLVEGELFDIVVFLDDGVPLVVRNVAAGSGSKTLVCTIDRPAHRVRVRLRTPDDREIAAPAVVEIIPADAPIARRRVTVEWGSAELVLPPGQYRVHAFRRDLEFEPVAVSIPRDELVIRASGRVEGLAPPIAIRVVSARTGGPIDGARIVLLGCSKGDSDPQRAPGEATTQSSWFTSETDSAGRTVLPHAAHGDAQLRVSAKGFATLECRHSRNEEGRVLRLVPSQR